MDRLWAPWRIGYVKNVGKTTGCFLCELPGEDRENDPANLIFHRGKTVFGILNRFPYNNGHLLIAPYRHLSGLSDLTGEEREELLRASGRATELLSEKLQAEGFNLGMNFGKLAGAGLPDHLHLHVLPRWNGDTNFLPTLTGTKVISQSLEEVHALLHGQLDA